MRSRGLRADAACKHVKLQASKQGKAGGALTSFCVSTAWEVAFCCSMASAASLRSPSNVATNCRRSSCAVCHAMSRKAQMENTMPLEQLNVTASVAMQALSMKQQLASHYSFRCPAPCVLPHQVQPYSENTLLLAH
jgi:hypothetical protein